MNPFRTSLTARLVSIAATVALAGGGLAIALDINPTLAIPTLLIAAIGIAIFGMILGVADHAGPVLVLAVLLPLGLWPYVMVLELVRASYPTWAWLLIASGMVPLGFTVILAPITARPHAPVKTAAQSV